MVDNNTQFFKQPEKTISVEGILEQVYLALKEKGYNPVNQMVGYITFACVFVAIMVIVMMVLSAVHFGEKKDVARQLKITIPETLNYTSAFNDLFDKYLSSFDLRKVKTTNMGTMFELTYNVFMKSGTDEKAFIDDLRMRNGNLNIILGYAETNQEILN